MNNVILTGRVTKDIELKSTNNGTKMVRFTLAVGSRKDNVADFPGCVAFGKTAELICRYVSKGHRIGVVGHLHTDHYTKNGTEVYTTDVVVESVEFLENKKTEEPAELINGDLPF